VHLDDACAFVAVHTDPMAHTKGQGGSQGTTPGPTVVAEVERKFDVDAGFTAPDLTGVKGVASVAEPVRHDLDATYFDSPDLRLVANKITLRRRTGGDDAGWHLKLPRADGDRNELREPLGRASRTVPASLRRLVEVHLRGAELEPAVRLATTRTVTRLLDDAGQPLAELAVDDVRASAPGPKGRSTQVSAWREVEVELVGGDRDLLAAVSERVQKAGARPSDSPSKLSRALGDRLPPRRPALPPGVREDSGAAVLLAHLGDHVQRLKKNDPLVRADEHDAVHQMRVATRRLRSALATFRPLLDRTVTDPIRDELKWLGTVLGDARDAEVIRDHVRAMVEAEPPELVLGPVLLRVVASLGTRYRTAHDAVLVQLDGARYFALLDSLDRLLTEPPLTPTANLDVDDALLPLVYRTWKRTRKLVHAAHAETDPHHHDLLLHEVRKASKRARYAGEALIPTHGGRARRWAARMEAIQEVLGAHQDSVVVREELRAMAVAAHLDGENAFTYGRLHAHEENRARDTELEFEKAWRAADRTKLHRWLR
jgi:CHAD domain-containing protein